VILAHAALGLRAHSGWAALVAVAGPVGAPTVIDRHRIELADADVAGAMQPYHAAARLELAKAEKVIERSVTRGRLLAVQALERVVGNVKGTGHDVVGCGILLASGRPITTLAATLASHALIHTAEGELFRSVLIYASEQCGLPVTRVRERELFTLAGAELAIPAHDLRARLAEMGRAVGPPWRQDEKYAALVAWLSLGGRHRSEEQEKDRRP
jgi:hypothetical protein